MSQILRFLIVGLGATSVHFAVVIALVEILGIDAIFSNGLAWAIALSVSYFGHFSWTFSATGEHAEHLPRFAVVSLFGLALNLLTVWLLHHQLGAHYLVATTLGVTLSIIVTFLASRFWAFSS